MRIRSLAVLTAVAAVAVPVTVAQAGSASDRATGGGQTLVGSKGAGDTIAFTAQATGDAVKGQVQYVDRTGGTGRGQQTFHYVVECVETNGNMARIGGFERDTGDPFDLYVTDNGEGANAVNGGDMIAFNNTNADGNCDRGDDEDEQPDVALARGNAQVHDGQ